VDYRLGCKACEPNTCGCGKAIDARGLHGLEECTKTACHSHLTDIIWWTMKRVQIPVVKDPLKLICGAIWMVNVQIAPPLHYGHMANLLSWDITVPKTYAVSHLSLTLQRGNAA